MAIAKSIQPVEEKDHLILQYSNLRAFINQAILFQATKEDFTISTSNSAISHKFCSYSKTWRLSGSMSENEKIKTIILYSLYHKLT